MIRYTAAFESGSVIRDYGKPLTHAWRVEYHVTKEPTQKGVKFGFSQSEEAAKKAAKLPGRYTVTKTELVLATAGETIAPKAPKKAAKADPKFKVFDRVSFPLASGAPGTRAFVCGTVDKVGRKYIFVKVEGAANAIKVAIDAAEPMPKPAFAEAA